MTESGWKCKICREGPTLVPIPGVMFPYTTMNIGSDPSQGPVKVESLRHLRQLERTYGVHSEAFNNNESNW